MNDPEKEALDALDRIHAELARADITPERRAELKVAESAQEDIIEALPL